MKRITLLIIGITLVVCTWWYFRGDSFVQRQRFYRFEPSLWAKSTPEERYYMAQYLVDRRSLIGLTQEDIITKLGTADSSHPANLLYDLGPEHGSYFQIDNDWLDIAIRSGTVESTRIRPD